MEPSGYELLKIET